MTGWQVIGITGWQDDGITGIFADDWPYGIFMELRLYLQYAEVKIFVHTLQMTL